jgi:hypothetical protein
MAVAATRTGMTLPGNGDAGMTVQTGRDMSEAPHLQIPPDIRQPSHHDRRQGNTAQRALMSGSMRSGAGRTAAVCSRSAGMPPAGPGRGRSSPGPGGQLPGLSSSARSQGPGLQPRNRGTGVLGRTRSRHHQLAGARGRLRCHEMAPGRSLDPGRDRRRAGHHYPGSPHSRAGRAASSGAACRPLRARVQPSPGQH